MQASVRWYVRLLLLLPALAASRSRTSVRVPARLGLAGQHRHAERRGQAPRDGHRASAVPQRGGAAAGGGGGAAARWRC
ncbi:MAG: hypothetical protein ACK4F6_19385, partial [Hylemonella sp.]